MSHVEILGLRLVNQPLTKNYSSQSKTSLYAHATNHPHWSHSEYIKTVELEKGFDTVDRALGDHQIDFPVDLALASGMVDMSWRQIYHQNAMTGLYLGFSEDPKQAADIDKADAIVEYNAKCRFGTIQPVDLRISTVLTDSNQVARAVGLNYQITPDMSLRLRTIGFSVSEDELPIKEDHHWWFDDRLDAYKIENQIPCYDPTIVSSIESVFEAPITEAMAAKVRGRWMLHSGNDYPSSQYIQAIRNAGYFVNKDSGVFGREHRESKDWLWTIPVPFYMSSTS